MTPSPKPALIRITEIKQKVYPTDFALTLGEVQKEIAFLVGIYGADAGFVYEKDYCESPYDKPSSCFCITTERDETDDEQKVRLFAEGSHINLQLAQELATYARLKIKFKDLD
jgi:hypothetical protein